MAHPRRFRFGVQVSKAADAKSWSELARKVEDLGFSTLFLPDHFGDQLAPLPAMVAAAAATTTLRVGGLVLDNDYKHPVVLAKEIATADVLSDGRVELGLGAGWMATDYEQSGIPYDEPRVRVDRFAEAITVLKGLFADGPCSFAGDHYTITALDGFPKPVQRPHPPLLIGGGGKRVLSIAAREADIVGISPNLAPGRVNREVAADSAPSRYDDKHGWVKEAAGDRFDDLEINCLMFAVIKTDDPKGTGEMMAGAFGVDPSEILDVPLAVFGTEDEMCERFEARRERWDMSYFVVQAEAVDVIAPVVARLAGT